MTTGLGVYSSLFNKDSLFAILGMISITLEPPHLYMYNVYIVTVNTSRLVTEYTNET